MLPRNGLAMKGMQFSLEVYFWKISIHNLKFYLFYIFYNFFLSLKIIYFFIETLHLYWNLTIIYTMNIYYCKCTLCVCVYVCNLPRTKPLSIAKNCKRNTLFRWQKKYRSFASYVKWYLLRSYYFDHNKNKNNIIRVYIEYRAPYDLLFAMYFLTYIYINKTDKATRKLKTIIKML